ncbi:hypothetical protein L6164_004566 [Bauhinia variegata]|uniref:Uncharacterized protein n=1 Tax=Bauhinia variegata TaxID=167791 RepID=A0ACB9Q3X3_BAUVA|nr:hypothetical protein L6164_004566 [Bauhinia variegata]
MRHMGSPMRSVTREGFPLCPTSQSLSIFSTATLCLSSSYSFITINGSPSISNGGFGQFSAAIFKDMVVNEDTTPSEKERKRERKMDRYNSPLLLLVFTAWLSILQCPSISLFVCIYKLPRIC